MPPLIHAGKVAVLKPLGIAPAGLTEASTGNANVFSNPHMNSRLNMHPIQADDCEILTGGSWENRMPLLP
jgi:hypothetical protein